MKLYQRRPSDWCCFQSGAPLWGPDLTPCSWRGVSSPLRTVWTSATPGPASLLCAACGWSFPRAWGVCVCVCVCTCMFTPADHSPGGRRARWGAGGGEPPAVSRACSRALSLPVLLSGDVRCPGLRPPRPTFSSQEDPRAPPACDPRPEALQTVSGGCLGVCLVCSSVGNHCPVPTHVWNVCWVGAESSPRCVLSVEADVLLRGCRSAAILLVRGEET